MPTVQRSTSRNQWAGEPTANTIRRRMVLGQLSKAMCITALFSVVLDGGNGWAAKRGGESNMDLRSEAALENRQLRLSVEMHEDALRMHWASFKSIPTIAQVMAVRTGWVRSHAKRIGLEVRPRSSIIGGT